MEESPAPGAGAQRPSDPAGFAPAAGPGAGAARRGRLGGLGSLAAGASPSPASSLGGSAGVPGFAPAAGPGAGAARRGRLGGLGLDTRLSPPVSPRAAATAPASTRSSSGPAASRASGRSSRSTSRSSAGASSSASRSASRDASRAAYKAEVNKRWQGWQRVDSVEAAERELQVLAQQRRRQQPRRQFNGLLNHVHLGPNLLLDRSGNRAALALKAFSQQSCLYTTMGRPYAHSEDLEAAAADPQCGAFAVDCFCTAAHAAEQAVQHVQGGRLRALSVQAILNEPGKSGPHQDSAGSSPSSDGASVATGSCDYRAVVRASLQPAPAGGGSQQLGDFAFTFSQVAANGGVAIDLSTSSLVASKFILGKGSPLYHQVGVRFGGIISFLVELVAAGSLPRHMSFFQKALAAYRAKPPAAPPALPPPAELAALLPDGPAAVVLRPVSPAPKLHNTSAAGTKSMAKDGTRPEDGVSVRAASTGSKGGTIASTNAWAQDRERKLADLEAARGMIGERTSAFESRRLERAKEGAATEYDAIAGGHPQLAAAVQAALQSGASKFYGLHALPTPRRNFPDQERKWGGHLASLRRAADGGEAPAAVLGSVGELLARRLVSWSSDHAALLDSHGFQAERHAAEAWVREQQGQGQEDELRAAFSAYVKGVKAEPDIKAAKQTAKRAAKRRAAVAGVQQQQEQQQQGGDADVPHAKRHAGPGAH